MFETLMCTIHMLVVPLPLHSFNNLIVSHMKSTIIYMYAQSPSAYFVESSYDQNVKYRILSKEWLADRIFIIHSWFRQLALKN